MAEPTDTKNPGNRGPRSIHAATDTPTADFYAEVGKRVVLHRINAGLTQEEVAQACGLTRSSIANLEAGRQHVPTHTLAAIATALGVGPADLMPGSTIPDSIALIQLVRRLYGELEMFMKYFGAEADDAT